MARSKFLEMLLLKPLSVVYGWIVSFRNWMFNVRLLKQHEFDVPVVVVGNLSVGGTGKTPHTEYVVDILKNEYRIAILSRGYKRHTKGFIIADRRSTPSDIGDEPYQIFQKFGNDVRVAVCEDRVAGIRELLRLDPSINLVVLDDAFQHRYVKPKVSIVLMEWNRPVYNDDMMPLGRLREPQRGLLRADMVVITKCPPEIRPMDVRIFNDNLDLFPHQNIYFSHYRYGTLVSVFPDEARSIPNLSWLNSSDSILMVSGIANPKPMVRYLRNRGLTVKVKRYPDHHDFTRGDLEDIGTIFNKMEGHSKYIVTTEKDAVRLANNPYFPHALKAVTFYLPINVEMLGPTMPVNALPFDQELRKKIRQKTS